MCKHLRTEISTPNQEGKSILKCKDCGYTKEILSSFFAIEDALRNGTLKPRQIKQGDRKQPELRHDFQLGITNLRS